MAPRFPALAVALFAAGCSAPPPPAEVRAPDPTQSEAYGQSVAELEKLNRDAADLLRGGKAEEAAALVTQAQPVAAKLLAARQPTLAAMQAASDHDDLYARMLLGNRHYEWARMLFQKNAARWKQWQPQTAETARRRKLAESEIAECDRRMSE